MNVSAIIVTRGNVDLQPVLDSLPDDWEIIVWDNGLGGVWRATGEDQGFLAEVPDLSVYGRYAAIEYASHDLIYVQDDDVIVSDPQAIVRAWTNRKVFDGLMGNESVPYLVANMPQEFRHDGYTDSCLVGFGCCFHRDLPRKAFQRFESGFADLPEQFAEEPFRSRFLRTCDVVFTTLTPRVLVDVPIQHREFASAPDRMWRQPSHVSERAEMLRLARKVRDA